ncbi:MAG: hypothetical protein IKN04_22495 [Clostridia bacterium]|nr:hypothetical protein [Clostridia bacterium]
MGVFLMQKELAELVGKTDRQIRNIDREQDDNRKLLVKGEGGKFDAAVFVQRWVTLQIEKLTEGMEDLDAVKARHEIVKTEKTTLEVQRMRGELIDVHDIRKAWGDVANTVMQGMIHLPSTIAPMVQGLDNVEVIGSIIDAEIRRVLNNIAATPLPSYAADEPTTEETEEAEE